MIGFFAAENLPFAVATCLVGLIALLEVAGMLFGFSASGAVDSQIPDLHADGFDGVVAPHEVDFHGPDVVGPGPLSQVLSWLCVGKVPILILIIVFLCAFALSGFVLQGLAAAILGTPLPAVVAALPALAAAFPATRYVGLGLARIVPKEESEAVSQASFVGKVAVVMGGEARRGLAAEAKLRDAHGQVHYVRVEPDQEGVTFKPGAEVLIVQHEGSIYRVIANANSAMTDQPT